METGKNAAAKENPKRMGSASPSASLAGILGAPRLMALALFLLAASPPLFAAFSDYMQGYGATFASQLGGWMGLCIIAILIGIAFNTLVYMVGQAMESQHLKMYAKAELMQVIASSLMIFFAVALLYGLTGGFGTAFDLMGEQLGTGQSYLPCSAAPGNKFNIWDGVQPFGSGPLGAFKCKLQEKITAIDKKYDKIFKANKPVEQLGTVCFSLLGFTVYCGDWDLSLHKQVEQAHLLCAKLLDLSVSLQAQYSLASYMQNNMLQVFLPMGLALRIFPFTRGVGGLFIAMAIGFFFVWPTFYLLTDPTFVRVDAAPAGGTEQGVCYTGFKGATTLLSGSFWSTSVGASDEALSDGATLLYQLTISSLYYPFVALVIALVFIRAATPILGGDMGELMKMISRLG